MRFALCITLLALLFACQPATDHSAALQSRIDTLEVQMANTYKPDFGFFMLRMQQHHTKLWFAGEKQNWTLAEFQITKIIETVGAIKLYETDRKESQMLDMINAPIDSVYHAIQQKDLAAFKRSYTLLTFTCNNCHKAAKFGFNVIKIPDTEMFGNQDFKSTE